MKSQYRMLFAIVVLLIAVGCLCNGSNFAPSIPSVNGPAATSAPVQTQGVSQPATDQPTGGEKFFTEEFDGDLTNWTYFTSKNDTKGDDTGAQPTTDNGFLVMDIKKYLNVYAIYEPQTYEDVRLDVSVDNRGTNNNNINLVCRYSDEGWYEISIANNGLYWLYAVDASKGSYTKLADGGSSKIKAGKEVNEYTFICNGRNLALQINGVDTTTYTDNQFDFREGKIGVGLSSLKISRSKLSLIG